MAVMVVHVPNAAPEAQETLRGHFRREARFAVRLRRANVATVFDYGTDDTLGLDYLVKELLVGRGRSSLGWSGRRDPDASNAEDPGRRCSRIEGAILPA